MCPKLRSNFQQVLKKIAGKAILIAVTKKRSIEQIKELYDLGQRDFGENRIEELISKADDLSSLEGIRWHFIGNIQSKKLSQILSVRNLFMIHSVDRIKVIEGLASHKCAVKVLLQANISKEAVKSGFESSELLKEASELALSRGLKLSGFMGMASQSIELAGDAFKQLREFRDLNYPSLELSMGMSQDFHIALEHGSTLVRVGSLIFES